LLKRKDTLKKVKVENHGKLKESMQNILSVAIGDRHNAQNPDETESNEDWE